MPISWTMQARQFKSPLGVVAGFLLRSRETQARRAQEQAQEILRLKGVMAKQEKRIAELRASKDEQISALRIENQRLRCQPVVLPHDPPLSGHKFGSKMMALAVNCARTVGFRSAERVLKLLQTWLGVPIPVPTWSTIRTWLLRIGLAQIADPATFERADDYIWLVDHSNQIGQEKLLVVLAVRASRMPPPGQALRHEDVQVLTIKLGTRWKQEDVARVYLELEEAFGTPRAVLSDGASELQKSAEQLQNKGRIASDIFRDLKHIAANILKAELGKDQPFEEFTAMLGKTRSSIQQTELGHLTPPGKKTKARFMNIASNLRWAEMVLWGLQHPEAKLWEGATSERIEEKLGWLRGFESKLIEWNECQRIISAAVKFGAEQGVSLGATECLRREIGAVLPLASVERIRAELLAFMEEAENKLQSGERIPISTEILESAFGLYKSLERQHSKSGFTSLVASLPALLRPATPELVKTSLAKISNQTARNWTKRTLGPTLTSKKTAAYAEHRNFKCATINSEMT